MRFFMNILAALDDRNLLGASIRDAESWKPWRALLAAAFGLPLDPGANWRFIASARGAVCRLARLPRTCGCVSAAGAGKASAWL
jgi:hypothetical protein